MAIARRELLYGTAAALAGGSSARGQAPATSSPPWALQAAPTGSPQDELRLHNDWAQLAQYREDDIQVRTLPAAARRVVFMGDSITRAWRVSRPEFFTASGYIDRGISGQTTPQMLVRFRQDVISLNPEAVHLMAGTNDIAENTGPFDPQAAMNNLMSMTDLARIHRLRVILGAIPPAAAFPWRAVANPVLKIRTMNEWLRSFAKLNGFAFADYTAVLDNGQGAMKPGLAYDGVHPTREGYEVMEPVAAAAIAIALA